MSQSNNQRREDTLQEDLDLATALSLSESADLKRPPSPVSGTLSSSRPTSKGPSEQQNLSQSFSKRFGNFVQSLFDRSSTDKNVNFCGRCSQPLTYGRYVIIRNQKFHPECFCCTSCGEVLTQNVSYYGDPALPYHPACLQAILLTDSPNVPSSSSSSSSSCCSSCQKRITSGEYITVQNRLYHKDCFRCSACHQLILSQVRFEEDLPYHSDCAKELFNPHCCLCCRALDGTYARHPYFSSEMYCWEHSQSQSLKTCYSCGRKEPLPDSKKEPFVDLPDGRCLCVSCSSTIIMDSSEASEIYQQILRFFEEELHLRIPSEMRSVPILAVDSQAINENSARSTVGNHTSNANTRGLTLTSIGTIRHFNRNFLPQLTANNGRQLIRDPASFFNQQQLFRIEQVRDVTAVLVLYGLPRDLFASILAHEATHVWLKLNKTVPYDLPPEVEEGVCQLIAFKYLEHLDRSSKEKKEDESELHFFQYQIENDRSLIYGDGFRAAKKVEASLGLEVLLEYISQNRSFPVV